jgi:hypothetical protein
MANLLLDVISMNHGRSVIGPTPASSVANQAAGAFGNVPVFAYEEGAPFA